MAEKLRDLVEAPTGIGEVAPEGVSQLVRCNRGGQPGTPRGGPQQFVDRIRTKRCSERLTEQVHDQEVAAGRTRVVQPLEDVGVQRPHHEGVEGHDTRAAGLRPRLVRVVPPVHVQVGPFHLTAQAPGVTDHVEVAAPQPAQLAAP